MPAAKKRKSAKSDDLFAALDKQVGKLRPSPRQPTASKPGR